MRQAWLGASGCSGEAQRPTRHCSPCHVHSVALCPQGECTDREDAFSDAPGLDAFGRKSGPITRLSNHDTAVDHGARCPARTVPRHHSRTWKALEDGPMDRHCSWARRVGDRYLILDFHPSTKKVAAPV